MVLISKMQRTLIWLALAIVSAKAFAFSPSTSPIIIGLDADMSAVAKEGGIAIQRGAQIAISEINAKGGVLGRPLKLEVSNHRGNPARGQFNLKKAVKNPDLVAMLGGVHTPVVLQQLELIHQHKVPFLIPWAAGTPIIDNSYQPNFVFRVSVRDAEAADVLVKNAKQDGHNKIALMLEQTGWGRSNEASMRAASDKYKIQISQIEWFNWRQPSMLNELNRIKESGATAILLVANAPEGVTIAQEIASTEGLNRLAIYSHWGIAGGDFVENLGLKKLHKLNLKVLQTYSFSAPSNVQKNQYVIEQYRKQFDENVTSDSIQGAVGVAHAYDLVHLLALAIEQAKSTERIAIQKALENLPSYRGLLKTYAPAFTPNRHDSLFSVDYFLSTYDENGHLIPPSHAEK